MRRRIMYVHVPAAWVAMAGYAALAVVSFFSVVWRHPLADLAAEEIGPVGAGFTAVCLVSGLALGQADVGRLLGVGRAADLGAGAVVFVSGAYRADPGVR